MRAQARDLLPETRRLSPLGRVLGQRLGRLQVLLQGRKGLAGVARSGIVPPLRLLLVLRDILLVVVHHVLDELTVKGIARQLRHAVVHSHMRTRAKAWARRAESCPGAPAPWT